VAGSIVQSPEDFGHGRPEGAMPFIINSNIFHYCVAWTCLAVVPCGSGCRNTAPSLADILVGQNPFVAMGMPILRFPPQICENMDMKLLT